MEAPQNDRDARASDERDQSGRSVVQADTPTAVTLAIVSV